MLGTLLNEHYKIIQVLGAGGFGQTYLAEDTQNPDHPKYVLKQFKPASQDAVFLKVARRLFDTEVQTLRKLGVHDQIPDMIDYFEQDQEFYLVQEFIDGIALSDKLAAVKRLDEDQVFQLLMDVLEVLEFVHSNQVIHRDIKPANLIQRRYDGKFVLIDFGAVKEIQTQLATDLGQTGLTVGIGTQGYMPSEQVMGKPRFNSDLFALGMTAIQALTGRHPSQLPENPETAELIWQDQAQVSDRLAAILSKMVRYHFSQRFQSVPEVLQVMRGEADIPEYETAIAPTTFSDAYLETMISQEPATGWRKYFGIGVRGVAIASVAVTSLLMGVRQLSGLQPLELAAYDRMVQLRGDAGIDDRLLIVGITEADIHAQKQFPISDRALAKALKQLQQYRPQLIGLDLHRNVPQEPGNAELLTQLKANNLIAITQLGEGDTPDVPPPPGVPSDRIGFNDLVFDPDNVIRRSLLLGSTQQADFYSFSMRLALAYLAPQGIKPRNAPFNPDYLQLGEQVFIPLLQDAGGYQSNDPRGFQILLNYRSPKNVARQVTLMEVLDGKVDPAWVKDKIVLIGTTAPSAKDVFYTPYSPAQSDTATMAGVVVHAQMVSQLLSAVLDDQRLFWFWPEWAEVLWMAGWAVVGGTVTWYVRHPLMLSLSGTAVLLVLLGSCFVIFTQRGWVPVAAPVLAAIVTGGLVIAYRVQIVHRQQQMMLTMMQGKAGK